MRSAIRSVASRYRQVCTNAAAWTESHATAFMFVLGICLLSGGLAELSLAQGGGPSGSYSQSQFDDTLIRNSVGNLFKLIEGAFGALIMVVSGLGAIVAAAMGAYRAAVGMLVVAVGAFILRSLVSLFFGAEFQDYES